jgi:lipopolysaccharide/colanic/teichoic acid biosynthesis glycosyltransferase
MRILMLTQWFNPEPFFKGLPFAKELLKRGHAVEVLTGFPNYPEGKVYEGYRIKPWQRESIDGIRVNRVPLYPSHNESGFKRIINYLSFGICACFLGPWLVRKPDVVYVYNLITLAWAACFLRWIYGCKVVYDVQDLWPESVASSGMMKNRFILGLLNRWSLWAYRKADHIVVLSPGFKKNLQARGIPDEKIQVIYNWCEEQPVRQETPGDNLAEDFGLCDTFNVVFAGTMGVMQGLDVVLDAARICTDSDPNVRFILVGDGVEKARLVARANDLKLSNVVFIPRQPMAEMGNIFDLASALLVHLKKDDLFKITIPSKTQAYLAAGRPIIMALEGDAAALVEEAAAGVRCNSDDPDALALTVSKLSKMKRENLEELGGNGKKFYQEKLSINCGAGCFESIFIELGRRCGSSAFSKVLKMLMDYTLVIPGSLLILPVMVALAVAVKKKLGSPVLFRQIRPGMHSKPFAMYKFRTMTDERDNHGDLLPDDQRLTRFGKLLRSTSLDEFPALINVLKGEMSLVGPRPLLMEYLPLYSPEQARRHEVRPGITGWAQVNGRNAISWEEKFKLDVWYVDNRSLWLDIKILWMTFAKVFRREGISQEGQATMTKFLGSAEEGK